MSERWFWRGWHTQRARRTHNLPAIQISQGRDAYPAHGAPGFAHDTHSQGPKNIAKSLQILVKAIKSRGRPYDNSSPSNFVDDMVFIRCLKITQKHEVNHKKITKKTMAGVAKLCC